MTPLVPKHARAPLLTTHGGKVIDARRNQP